MIYAAAGATCAETLTICSPPPSGFGHRVPEGLRS